jgi:hypothetical protein
MNIIILIILIWVLGWYLTHMHAVDPYIKKRGIKTQDEQTKEDEYYLNNVFIRMAYYWPFYWLKIWWDKL